MGLHAEGPLEHRKPPPPGVFYLWPEHAQSYAIFCASVTQWRVGVEGREGLDYTGVDHVMRRASGQPSGFAWDDYTRIWDELRVLERGALIAWADQRKKRQN